MKLILRKNVFVAIVLLIISTTYSQTDGPCLATLLTVGAGCTYTNGTTVGATYQNNPANGGTPSCASPGAPDVWYRFVATNTTQIITTDVGTITDGGLAIYSGACGALTQITCNDDDGPGNMSLITATGLTIGTTYYLRVWQWGGTGTGTFQICVTNPPPAPANDNCGTAVALTHEVMGNCTLTNGTVAGATNSGIASCTGTTDDDVWYSFIATSSTAIIRRITTGGWDSGIELFNSLGAAPGTCIGTSIGCQDSEADYNVSGLIVGRRYYVRVYSWGAGLTPSPPTFTICITTTPPPPANDDPCSAIALTVNTGCIYSTYTNASATGSPSVPAPGCAGYFGGDVWFTAVVPPSGILNINTNTGVVVDAGMALYTGACGSLTLIACDDDGSQNGAMPMITVSTQPPGTTIYIRVWENFNDNNGTFNICANNPCTGGAAVNDLPCNATPLTAGVPEVGNNSCAGGLSEPAIPACWTTGAANTVWYSFVATSANMSVKTSLGSLTDTQIGIFSGTCGSLTLVAGACNNNEPNCGPTPILSSIVNLTGLSVGTTYFVSVDGADNLTGSFTLWLVPTGTPFPPVPGQDCVAPNPVCSSTITAADPGYQGIGNSCDLPGSYCLQSAERGSVWYSFTTNAAGNINFDIIPNNWPGMPSLTAADYDFALWRITGSVSCVTMLAGTAIPDRCNYNSLGVTGLSPTGNAPGAYPGFDGAYESQMPCANGDQFILVINNHSTSTDGFTINFLGSPINYSGTPTTVSWTGGANTAWNNSINWGSCAFPTCGISAYVNPFVNQPNVIGTMSVNDLTINSGSTLTLSAGSTLNICGHFTNLGSIIADPTSTIVMMGAGTQNMTGSFVGANSLGHLTIAKTTGTVVTNDDVSMKGNFLTSNVTSIFNSNNKYIRVAGNFTNNNGNATFTNTGALGSLEFNGSSTQTYNQGSTQLDLNFVTMNQTGAPGLTLLSNMFIKITTGTLTLTNGKINTGVNRVDVANVANASVTIGNTTSYINGNLYRSLNGLAGAYDFPLGTAALYERANINFTTATAIPRLQTRFDPWGAPTNHICGLSECGTTYNLLSENAGFWTLNASANPTSGTYNATLYCNGSTNTTAANAWTVEKSTNGGGNWTLSGTCVPTSTATVVRRNNMNGFSIFSATQATSPLPIELLNFSGHSVETRNQLVWSTASEINNHYFSLEKSSDGINFTELGRIEGAGNSNSELNYIYIDSEPHIPITYYRLKQADFNDTYVYSDIIFITNTNFQEIVVNKIHPNPSNGIFYVDLFVKQSEQLTFEICDTYGKIMSHTLYELAGAKTIEVDGSLWATGVYLLKLKSGISGKEQIFKIIKIN